jgi:hypothetical protein
VPTVVTAAGVDEAVGAFVGGSDTSAAVDWGSAVVVSAGVHPETTRT